MNRKRFLLIMLFALAAAGITANAPMPEDLSAWVPERPSAAAEAVCQSHLREAEKKMADAIFHRAAEFSDFIRSRKAGAVPFSKDIISLYGKWRAISCHLPFTDGDGHRKYVIEMFNQRIFTSTELAKALERSINGAIKDIEAIEADLAVALRGEILGRPLAPDEIQGAVEEFRNTLGRLDAASRWDAAKGAGGMIVSQSAAHVSSHVASQALVHVGVSAGILAVGALNFWWSFGASLAISMMIDIVWEWIDNPAGDIAEEVSAALNALSSEGTSFIQNEMARISSGRSMLWSRTLQNFPRS